MDFNFDRDQLPPVLADTLWDRLPSLCTGVVLFDILIANADRHDENLVVDNVLKPSAMRVFDHDQALFGGGGSLRGEERLRKLTNRLGISGGPVTDGTGHCLIDEIASTTYFREWLQRIDDLPKWFITHVCSEARKYGLTPDEAKAARTFLIERRTMFPDLIDQNRDQFTAITEWTKRGRLL